MPAVRYRSEWSDADGQDWRIEMNPHDGLTEFPAELGFETYFNHSRRSNW